MQSSIELTEGKRKLKEVLDTFPANSAHWNEAQNRFQFIDRLLTECLGWQKPDIKPEHRDELGGISDYLLGQHPPKAILEAKREAIIFDVPPTGGKGLVRKMASLLESSKSFKSAVHQVLPYCAINGAQIGIVCNGPQTAIFQALVPGQSPLEGECYFFDGFDDYLSNFPTLWKLLSPEGITENRAYRDLALYRNPRMPPKGSAAIAEPNRYRYRNNFQENLRSLSSLLLEEIEDNPALKSSFYEECYVPIEANNRHLLLSKNIISSRYKRAGDDNIHPSALNEVTSVSNTGDLEFNDPAFVGNIGSRPVIVLGDVGVGKTSFFENLFQSLGANEKADTFFIHINLGIKANLSDDVKSHVIAEIPAVLKTRYDIDIDSADFANAIYYKDLKDFDLSVKGALKDVDLNTYTLERVAFLSEKIARRDRHLDAALGHLAQGRKKRIILVLDNADQRTFAVQQETYLIAQEFAASRNVLV
jgi:GTPase SAR1 family protein